MGRLFSRDQILLLRYFVEYTILFTASCIIIYFTFLVNGKSFLWKPDGPSLHWMSLAYYGRWLRELAGSIAAGAPALHEYDFSIGYGSPIISTLHWDVIGDPFNLLSYFVQPNKTEYLLNALVILRLYLAGAAFSIYCFRMKKSSLAVMAGTFSYIFCGYSIYTAIRHPHFINPMILFPLLLIGIERILEKRKHGFFAFMVFISLMSSFYFSYMLGIFSLGYFVLRYFTLERKKGIRDFLSDLIHIIVPGLIGIAMSCVILIPVIRLYMTGLRISSDIKYPVLYSLNYYEKMITDLLTVESPGSWTHLGVTVTAFIALLALFGKNVSRKAITSDEQTARAPEHSRTEISQELSRKVSDNLILRRKVIILRTAVMISFIMFLIPAAGSALNGFNYVSNRWEWAFSALISYALAFVWPDLFSLESRQKKFVYTGTGIYFILILFLNQGVFRSTFAAVCVLFIAAFLVYLANQPREAVRAQRWLSSFHGSIPYALIIVTILHICVNAHFYYDATKEDYVSEFTDYRHMYSDLTSTPSCAVLAAENDDNGETQSDENDSSTAELPQENGSGETKLPQGSGTGMTSAGSISRYEQQYYDQNLLNPDIMTRANGVQYYFSLANGSISQYLMDMGLNSWISYKYEGLNRRTMLDTLAGVKYFTVSAGGSALDIPYGFENKASYTAGPLNCSYDIYTNSNALPLGYTYSSYITRDSYSKMTPAQRQEALMQGALLENDDGGIEMAKSQTSEADVKYTEKSVDYEVECDANVKQLSDGSFLAGKDGAQITLSFDGKKNCETYLYISGITAKRESELSLYTDDDQDILPYKEFQQLSMLDRNMIMRDGLYSGEWDDRSKLFDIGVDCDGAGGVISYRTDRDLYYIGQKDFLINLGWREDKRKQITITFPAAGTYSFEDMQVICQPMKAYAAQAKALSDDTLMDEKHSTDTLTGTVDLDRGKILLLTIPYDEGWTAYVDGLETPIYRANVMNSALVLSSGTHSIRLVYHTPGLRHGLIITAAGFAAFAVMLLAQFISGIRTKRADRAKRRSDKTAGQQV